MTDVALDARTKFPQGQTGPEESANFLYQGLPSPNVPRKEGGYGVLRRLHFIRPVLPDNENGNTADYRAYLPGPVGTKFQGFYVNYTPVADDSYIQVKCMFYAYRGNSSSGYDSYYFGTVALCIDGTPVNYHYILNYTGGGYKEMTFHVPSWGKGIQKEISIRMMSNYDAEGTQGYYRLNVDTGINWRTAYTGRRLEGSQRQLIIEELENAEPGQPAIIRWDPQNLNF